MKSTIRLPQNFKEYLNEPIISNSDNLINAQIATAIKDKPLYSLYTALHFLGKVWFDDTIGYWTAEIWQYKSYKASYIAETIEELANEIDTEYGKGEHPFLLDV